MTAAAGSAEELGTAVGRTERGLIGAGRQAGLASAQTGKLRIAQLTAVAAQERYNAALTSGSASTARLATTEAALLRANERVRASMPTAAVLQTGRASEVAAAQMGGFRASAASTIGTFAKLGVGLGAFELARKAIEFVSAGKELTDSLNQIQAASRATDHEMAATRAQAIALGQDLTVPAATAVDAADAILDLVKAGIQLPRAMLAARSALLLASATQSDMTDTAKVLGDTMDIWSIKGENAAHAADIIGSATLGASHDLLGFFDELKQAGPTAQALGIDLDHTSAALVLLAKHGISATVGGAGLKTMLTNLTKDVPKAKHALADMGVQAFTTQGQFVGFTSLFDQLHAAQGRFGKDSERFVGDLNAAFGVRSQSVAALFAKEGGAAYDEVLKRLESGSLQKYADEMNRGVAAGFRQLNKEATAAGIAVYSKFEPAMTTAVMWLGTNLPRAVKSAQSVLQPLEHFVGGALSTAFHLLGDGAHYAGDVLGPVSHVIGDMKTPLGAAAAGAIAMWAALKLGRGVAVAVDALRFALASLSGTVRNGMTTMQAWGRGASATFAGNATESQLAARIMQADFAAIEAGALEAAAAVDRAAAIEAVAFADMTAASAASSDAQVLAADEAAAAATAQARASAIAAGASVAAAEEAALAVNAAGDEAAIGWTAVLGPIGLVAVGLAAVIAMFHQSDNASKEATAAAKAYTDALKSGDGRAGIVDTITKQLEDNNVPESIDKLNKALGSVAFTGKQFVSAITAGGKPLADLRAHLQDVIKSGTTLAKSVTVGKNSTYIPEKLTPAAIAATDALKHLNTQYSTLSKQTVKDLLDTKTFAGASSSIDKTSQSLGVATGTAKGYAAMVGIVGDKNGVTTLTQEALDAAVHGVAQAFATASESGNEFLGALNTFSQSGGTAADRAALIAATLKNANGEALNFATTMNAAAGAERQLTTDVRSASGAEKAAAKAKKDGTDQTAAAVAANKKYLDSVINLKTGTIDYNKAAAGPLLSDMQSMQTAAMASAQAKFQDARATMSGKDAAAAAYKVYRAQTSVALVDQLTKLGLAAPAAKKLAEQYFGMPKHVKTLIEQEGSDPILTVLNKIGKLLADLTHQPWTAVVGADVDFSGLNAFEAQLNRIAGRHVAAHVNTNTGAAEGPGAATGGTAGDVVRRFATGGRSGDGPSGTVVGPGSDTSDSVLIRVSPDEEIIRASQARKHRRLLKAINAGAAGFAGGGTPGITTGMSDGKKVYIYNGHKYSTLTSAENAETSARKADKNSALSTAKSAVSGIQVSILPPSPSALKQFESAVDNATKKIHAAAAAGVDPKQVDAMRAQLVHMVKEANHQLSNLRVKVNGHDMNVLTQSLKGSAADVRSAFQAMMADARAAGLSAHAVAVAQSREDHLEAHVNTRNRLQAQLGTRATRPTAYDALATARDNRAQEKATVSAATSGFFNITSAGTGPNGDQTASFGSFKAQQLHAKAVILKWAAGLKKLGSVFGKSKAGQHMLQQFAEEGPSTLPQIEALLSGGSAGLKSVIATEAAIDKAAASVGGYVGGVLDNAAVTKALTRVTQLEGRIKDQNDIIGGLDGKIEDGIKHGLDGLKLVIDPAGVAKLVAVGNKKLRRRGGDSGH